MMEDTKRIVEINGVKVEVDLREAKRVDSFKVGSKIKILIKEYSSYKSFHGMIVGFDEFKKMPTMIVAYISPERYSSESPLKIAYINSTTEDIEICPSDESDLGIERHEINDNFEKLIVTKQEEIKELNCKRSYFNSMFGKYFAPEVKS